MDLRFRRDNLVRGFAAPGFCARFSRSNSHLLLANDGRLTDLRSFWLVGAASALLAGGLGACAEACPEGFVEQPGTNGCLPLPANGSTSDLTDGKGLVGPGTAPPPPAVDLKVDEPVTSESCDPESATPVYSVALGRCVGCVTQDDCSADPSTPVCDTRTSHCIGCRYDGDCSGSADTPFCDTRSGVPTSGQCLACVPNRPDTCGGNVCNAQTLTCTTCKPYASMTPPLRSACRACVADAQCEPAEVCVQGVEDGEGSHGTCLVLANGSPTNEGCSASRVAFSARLFETRRPVRACQSIRPPSFCGAFEGCAIE